MWVSPFRDLRINGYVLLPAAFRSLSRLSSALSAKASTLRSSSLYLSIALAMAAALIYIALYMCFDLPPGSSRRSFCFLGCLDI